MREFLIRPHHMLCLQFFEGKGYSEEFVLHMAEIQKVLVKENPRVRLVHGTDDICFNCPNRQENRCIKEKDVKEHDERVWKQVKDKISEETTWNQITEEIYKSIIEPGKIKEVCVKCQWSDICFNKR